MNPTHDSSICGFHLSKQSGIQRSTEALVIQVKYLLSTASGPCNNGLCMTQLLDDRNCLQLIRTRQKIQSQYCIDIHCTLRSLANPASPPQYTVHPDPGYNVTASRIPDSTVVLTDHESVSPIMPKAQSWQCCASFTNLMLHDSI